jgi:general secretion pathway protein J
MMRPMTLRLDRGFTLLELLIALVVFGLLLIVLANGTRFALAARGLQAQRIATDEGLDAVDRTLRRLIGTMDPGVSSDGRPHFVANAHSMGFTGDLPIGAWFPTRQADVVISVDAAHRLVLRWAPHYPALLGPPPLPQVTPLLDGVNELDLSYWAGAPGHGAWVDRWDSAALPALVRLRIVFIRDSQRHWPDIVAATAVN